MKLNEKRLNFFPCRNVDSLTDFVKLKNLFRNFLEIYHLSPKRVSFFIVRRLRTDGRNRFYLELLFIIADLEIRIWGIGMWMTLNFFVNIFNLYADFVTIVFIVSLMKVHVQRKLSLLIVANVIDFLGQKRLIAYAHCINFVVKFIFFQLRVIVSGK